jgi:hypothetical protein
MQNPVDISIPVDSIVQVTFLILLIIYVIFTVILYYHWQSYSMDKKATLQTYLAYFIVTLPLLALMGLSTLII